MSATPEELCEQIIKARDAKDELKAQLDKVSAELGALESGLADLLVASDTPKLKHQGMVFTGSIKVGWKIVADEKEHLLGFLKEGAPELVKETVNAASLASYLRKNESTLEEEALSWWGSAKKCLTRQESNSVSIRKVPKKK